MVPERSRECRPSAWATAIVTWSAPQAGHHLDAEGEAVVVQTDRDLGHRRAGGH